MIHLYITRLYIIILDLVSNLHILHLFEIKSVFVKMTAKVQFIICSGVDLPGEKTSLTLLTIMKCINGNQVIAWTTVTHTVVLAVTQNLYILYIVRC